MLNDDHRAQLKRIAKEAIDYGLEHQQALIVDLPTMPEALIATRATFVTLEENEQLRGCIGMLEARRPLAQDVASNSYAAAFTDPRFPPVSRSESENITIHISILNPSELLSIESETELIQILRPNIDGIILEDDNHRATFLPSVWQSLPKPTSFIQHLKSKAGFAADYWSKDIRAYRYTTESF